MLANHCPPDYKAPEDKNNITRFAIFLQQYPFISQARKPLHCSPDYKATIKKEMFPVGIFISITRCERCCSQTGKPRSSPVYKTPDE